MVQRDVLICVDELLLALIEFILKVFGEILLQSVLELLAEALTKEESGYRSSATIVSALALVTGGALTGLLLSVAFPKRLLFVRVRLPGVSLILGPVLAGAAMHLIGNRLRRDGRKPTILATFWGGALFAFVVALIRVWRVGASFSPAVHDKLTSVLYPCHPFRVACLPISGSKTGDDSADTLAWVNQHLASP